MFNNITKEWQSFEWRSNEYGDKKMLCNQGSVCGFDNKIVKNILINIGLRVYHMKNNHMKNKQNDAMNRTKRRKEGWQKWSLSVSRNIKEQYGQENYSNI